MVKPVLSMFVKYGELVELDLPQEGVFGIPPAPAPRVFEVGQLLFAQHACSVHHVSPWQEGQPSDHQAGVGC